MAPARNGDVLRHDLQAKKALSTDMYRTTYNDTMELNAFEKKSPHNLNTLLIHRGKDPPPDSPHGTIRWDNRRNDWIRAPNYKHNFVADTWGSQWSIEHAKSIAENERFSPTSRHIGEQAFEALLGEEEVALTALDDLDVPQRVGSPVRGRRLRPCSAPRQRSRNSGVFASSGRTWGGIPVESLIRDSNPNNYGRWNRTASNVNGAAFLSYPRPGVRPLPANPYLTTKQIENMAASELFNKQGKWKCGYNYNKYCSNKWTSISADTPPWMKIGGIRIMPPQ